MKIKEKTTESETMSRPRSRSFSSTPTFSYDLAKLRSTSATGIVHSYTDAIAIASTFDVLGNNSTLTPKLKLNSDDDWIELFQKSGAVQNVGCGGDVVINIHLEKFLRYCFDIAYKMPPSPTNRVLRDHVRSKSELPRLGHSTPPLQI